MATTRKPARRRTTGRNSKTKKDRSWLRNLGFGFALLIFIATTVLATWLARDFFRPDGLNDASVEGVLVAAGVNLDKQREIVIKDGVERWKIDLKSASQKEQIMKGLRMSVEARGGKWTVGEEIKRQNDSVHLIDMADQNGKTLRLIFIVPLHEQKKPRLRVEPTVKEERPPPEKLVENKTPEKAKPVVLENLKPQDPPPPSNVDLGQPTIAIILDDIGQKEPGILAPVLDLKYPITFAVLPYLPYSSQNAHFLHRNRYEVMLHMPMEPDSSASDPGKGAIFAHFTMDQAREAVDRAMDNVPFIKGVNNHMGSKVTANRTLMGPILEQIKKRDLYFVDSRTKSNTVAFNVAQQQGMKSAKRDVFLDSEVTYAFVVKQLKEACKVADANGVAIAIGHPHPTTLQALADELPKMDSQGYRFVFASTVIEALHGNL